jgi:peptidoglycan/LPS O-acetylase OafA/YrhL
MGGRIIFADGLRGIAALSVVVAHYALAFWVPGPVIGQIANVPAVPAGVVPTLSAYVLDTPIFFSLAAFGVGLFFLISGFVIPLSLDRLDRVSFIRARSWRILPTYAVGFLFTLGALVVASQVYGRHFPYSPRNVAVHIIPGLRPLLGGPYIDYVVWTLETEISFYALCAATAPWLRRGSLLAFVPPTMLLSLAAGNIYPIHAAATDFMFVGVVVGFHHSGKISMGRALAIGTLVAATSLGGVFWTQGAIVTASYGVAVAVFLAAYLARSIFPDVALLRGLAAISYPLYVVHGIMGYVAMRIMLDYAITPGLCLILAFILALAVSSVLHVSVEVPTQLIGKRMWRSKGETLLPTPRWGRRMPTSAAQLFLAGPLTLPSSSPTKLRSGPKC